MQAINNTATHSESMRDGKAASAASQFSTFYVANRLYGIDVTRVQEVVRPMPITPIPLAPEYVTGLINLRGQVATAIGLRELLGLKDTPPDSFMNVVCRIDGSLISLQVDEIGDVIEVMMKDFETTPQTVPGEIRRFMTGIYKTTSSLLSIIDIERIGKFLNHKL
ncbi:MAG: chemotaxis protein CheW [Oligoflexales bacterium]|nr:chemotaxis protein CheW [Oligoflexales bacterium]